MNERIRELAEQAGINCVVPTEGTLEYSGKGEVEHLKKFAELIIEECVVIMSREIDEVENSVERNRTISEMMDLLEQHFGVE